VKASNEKWSWQILVHEIQMTGLSMLQFKQYFMALLYLLVIQLLTGTSKMCQLILCQNGQLQYLLLTMII
jgi:hypothetical protein